MRLSDLDSSTGKCYVSICSSHVHSYRYIHTHLLAFQSPTSSTVSSRRILTLLEIIPSVSAGYFSQHVKPNGDILLMRGNIWSQFGNGNMPRNTDALLFVIIVRSETAFFLLSDRMAKVLQLCSLVWEQPEPPHSAALFGPERCVSTVTDGDV